jgi:hypothetical protein
LKTIGISRPRSMSKELTTLLGQVRHAPTSAWVHVFGLKNTARGYRCPSCGNPWFTFVNVNSEVSGHCWGPKKCGLQGWGYVIGSKIWRLSWDQAAQRIAGLLDDAPYMRALSDVGQNESPASHTGLDRRVGALELVRERLGR